MDSGVMMGKYITDLEKPVTKTTGGLIVLPADHDLIQRYTKPLKAMHRIGHSACDQCSYCTELCPRYLLGYDIQPHLVMRSLGFTALGNDLWNKYATLCCHCGLCTLYSCPEALYPREACEQSIADLRKIGKGKWEGPREVQAHPMKEGRRVPIKMLMNRLGIAEFEAEATYDDREIKPKEVQILLQQHIGVPAEPVVKVGEVVSAGQLIAQIPADKLGAPIHASIDGKVKAVTNDRIVINAQ